VSETIKPRPGKCHAANAIHARHPMMSATKIAIQ